MIEQFYELKDIVLIPSSGNNGNPPMDQMDYSVTDDLERSSYAKSLPIFTRPSLDIVDENNAKFFADSGLKPVISKDLDLAKRLDLCTKVFCVFTLIEIKAMFLDRDMRNQNAQFHIYISESNGGNKDICTACSYLKRMYGQQVIVMAGDTTAPGSYTDLCRSGADYIVFGSQYPDLGYHYPLASLLDNLKVFRKSSPGLPKHSKVVVFGQIDDHESIIKAIALGADYVMLDLPLLRVLESSGKIYKGSRECTKEELMEIAQEGASLQGLERLENRPYGAPVRHRIQYKLHDWLGGLKNIAYYAFCMSGTKSWRELRVENKKYGVHV